MIAKELDEVTASDKRRTSGHAAEAQLAFYLRRSFADTPDLHVFNGLRFESFGDAAQLDHLTLHPYGLIVVESKSVYAKIKINERGEWLRLYKGHYQGMPSAKLQAERQVLFLRRYLEPHSAQLLDTSRGKRMNLSSMPVDLLVAVSDGAVIDRPKGEAHEYLVKAEAVPERIAVWTGLLPTLLTTTFTPVFLLAVWRYPILDDVFAATVIAADFLGDHPLT